MEQKQCRLKDARILLMNEILQGIKVVLSSTKNQKPFEHQIARFVTRTRTINFGLCYFVSFHRWSSIMHGRSPLWRKWRRPGRRRWPFNVNIYVEIFSWSFQVDCIIKYHYMLSGLNVTYTVVKQEPLYFCYLIKIEEIRSFILLLRCLCLSPSPPSSPTFMLILSIIGSLRKRLHFSSFIHNNNNISINICIKKVFACIAIFNLLRLPLFLFPTFLLRVVQVPTISSNHD